jgi:small subunit ribosomal protein S16
MAVKIRLKRTGMKKAPSYRVVIADARSPRDGRIIENIGWYNPRVEPSAINIDEEKALGWLKNGAQPTDSVASLLKRVGILARFEESKKAQPADSAAEA